MKKIIILLSIVLVLISMVFLFLCLHEKKDVEMTLNLFYEDFIDKDYANAYKNFDVKFRTDLSELEKQGHIANYLLNDRHWYGEIKGIKIISILWSGNNSRYAFVKVEYGRNESVIDRIKLKKINNEWVISKYDSGITIHLP